MEKNYKSIFNRLRYRVCGRYELGVVVRHAGGILEMIFTNVSYIGDFFLLWPVASWYYKARGEKIHFVVPEGYYMYPKVKKFLEHQEFCEAVTLVDIKKPSAWDQKSWKFNPSDFGIAGEYYNFGFQSHIDVYMSEYYAGLHDGFDYDRDMTLSLMEFPDTEVPKKVTIEIQGKRKGRWGSWHRMKATMPSDTVELNLSDTFEENIYKAYHAQERWMSSSSTPIILDMLGKTCNIFASHHIATMPYVFYRHSHRLILSGDIVKKDWSGT